MAPVPFCFRAAKVRLLRSTSQSDFKPGCDLVVRHVDIGDSQHEFLQVVLDCPGSGVQFIPASIDKHMNTENGGAFVPVYKTVISRNGLQESRGFCSDGTVVPDVGPTDRRLYSSVIDDAIAAATVVCESPLVCFERVTVCHVVVRLSRHAYFFARRSSTTAYFCSPFLRESVDFGVVYDPVRA